MLRFSANISMMFTELPFEARFEAARKAGFGAVEFLFPYEHAAEDVGRWLNESGLGLSVFNLPPGNWAAGQRGMAALDRRERDFRGGLDQAEPYVKALHGARVHMMAGIAEGGAAEARFVVSARRAADCMSKHGCKVLIEPINAADMPGYFLSRTDQALELLEKIDHENVGLQWDIYHHRRTHGAALDMLPDVLARADHIQIAGVPHRHEPEDYGQIFRALAEAQYAGWIGCEYRPRGETVEGLGWLKEVRDARAEA